MGNMRDLLEQVLKFIPILFRNAEMKPPSWSTKSNDKFEITYRKCYIGGWWEVETFLGTLHSNFWTNNNLFPAGDTDKVQYTLGDVRSWVNYLENSQRKTIMIDTVILGHDWLPRNYTHQHTYDHFVTKIQTQYGNQDRKQNSFTLAY